MKTTCFLWLLNADFFDDVICFNCFSVIVDYYCCFVVAVQSFGLLCRGKYFINKVDLRLEINCTKKYK